MHKNVFGMQKIFLAKLFIKNEKASRAGTKKEIFHDFLTKTPRERQNPRPKTHIFPFL